MAQKRLLEKRRQNEVVSNGKIFVSPPTRILLTIVLPVLGLLLPSILIRDFAAEVRRAGWVRIDTYIENDVRESPYEFGGRTTEVAPNKNHPSFEVRLNATTGVAVEKKWG